jgi:hypothetical protein
VLTLRHKEGIKRQDVAAQVARTKETAMEVRKVPSRQGIDAGVDAQVGALALALFDRFVESGGGGKDFSGIITMIRAGKPA